MHDQPAKILLVDDEPLVLDALRRSHRRRFALACALGPAAALDCLDREGPFAVIVSDHNMPGMDGVSLLERVRKIAPLTVRILLTGQTDAKVAALAASRGEVFRFVAKPCAAEELSAILVAAVQEHRALLARQRELDPSRADGGAS